LNEKRAKTAKSAHEIDEKTTEIEIENAIVTVEDETGNENETVAETKEGTEIGVIGIGVEVPVGQDYHTIFGGQVLTDR
jgi:hypothetical protein